LPPFPSNLPPFLQVHKSDYHPFIAHLLVVLIVVVLEIALVSCSGGVASSVGAATSGHLDWDTATEGASTSSVHAADHADVVDASDVSTAGLASWDSSLEWQINSLGVASAVLASNLGGDLHVDEVAAITGGVDLAGVWSGTVTVDLVESHGDCSAWRDLGELIAVHGQDSLRSGSDVVLTATEGLTASCGVVALEAGGVLLEGITLGPITRSVGINANGRTGTTFVTNSLDNGTMASHKLGGSDESNEGRFEKHPDPAGIIIK